MIGVGIVWTAAAIVVVGIVLPLLLRDLFRMPVAAPLDDEVA